MDSLTDHRNFDWKDFDYLFGRGFLGRMVREPEDDKLRAMNRQRNANVRLSQAEVDTLNRALHHTAWAPLTSRMIERSLIEEIFTQGMLKV